MSFSGFITNIRFYILLSSAFLAGGIYFFVLQTIPYDTAQISRLTQTYALTAVTYLYLALLISPLVRFFTFLPYRGLLVRARRAIGVSAFLFALLHAYNAFFGELGGFEGLLFLNFKYLTAVTLGATSLTILCLMVLTSFEWAVGKLSYKRWKFLHRFVYLVAILITIHALMLGSHFTDFSGWIPQIFSVALAFLLILEALRMDIYLADRFPNLPKAGVAFFVATLLIAILTIFTFVPGQFSGSLSLHDQHRHLVEDTQKTGASDYMKNMPGMQGDKTKRYTVDWDYSEPVKAGAENIIRFRIFDASNGEPVSLFTKNYERLMHLIIVDNTLNSYQHIHPEFKLSLPAGAVKDGWFEIPVTFPKDARYNLYLDFVPVGAIEQQIGLSLRTEGYSAGAPEDYKPDTDLIKKFGDYDIKLSFAQPLKAAQMSVGAAHLKFEVTKDGQPVTTLKPYLGSFGHLVMINTRTFEYSHVHTVQTGNLQPDQNGGPIVEFMPMSIYAPIKPGLYKLFAQLNPDNNLITAEFIVRVE